MPTDDIIRLKSLLAELDELLRFSEGLFNRYAGVVLDDKSSAARYSLLGLNTRQAWPSTTAL
jgi:hypothetical protein